MIRSAIRVAEAEHWQFQLDRPVGGSGVSSVGMVVVELENTKGARGMGFSYVLSGSAEGATRAARRLLDTYVRGQVPEHPEAMHRQMRASMNRTGRGPLYIGLAAVDLALWDLYARSLDLPLGLAMGGRARDVPVYGSGLFYSGQDPEEAAEAALAHIRRGLSAVKVRVSGTAADHRLLASVADAIGAKTLLAADLNEKGSPTSAARLARLLAEHGALFLEEPLPARELVAYERLSSRSPVAIASGEHLQGLDEALPHMRLGSCDVIQPDLAMMGGLTECLRVLRAADVLGVEVAPHFLPNLFVHLAAVSPSLTWLEDFPLLEPLFKDLPSISRNGRLQLPSASGHGLAFAEGAREAWVTAS